MFRKALIVSLFSVAVAVTANACVDCHWSYNPDTGVLSMDCVPPGPGDHCEGSFSGGTTTCNPAGDCNTCFDPTRPIPDCGRGPDQNGEVLNAPARVKEAFLRRDGVPSVVAALSR